MGVSTFDLLTVNGLEGYCASFPSAGSSLCTPHKCTTYTIKENDTCYSISEANAGSPTISQLVSWNPNFNRDCSNIDQAVGFDICVSFPGESSAIDNSQPPSAPAPIPSDIVEGTNTNCSRYYKISNGDYCASVTVQEGISLKDFYFLNPEINSTTCSNLLLGYSYCVAPVGDISLYPGYSPASPNGKDDPCKSADAPDSCFATFPDEDDWEWPTQTGGSPTTSSTSTAAPTVVTLPFASGTLEKCDQYDQYYNSSSKRVNINGCYVVAQVHGSK
ncbi:hypothetical protein E4T52_11517 [Aureobasidium sp. EXF-3400]|nr:hypothetical protein E4T51_10531 [Aureobasidium sp. EXF-12344]KAI4773495.1 hypothetical protein E4T52_11517 [Aureobasidium sp. EXF-3400]